MILGLGVRPGRGKECGEDKNNETHHPSSVLHVLEITCIIKY